MKFRENYEMFVEILQDILQMKEERKYFIHSFQNSVWKLTHTDSKEFGVLSDLAYYFYASEDCILSENCDEEIRKAIKALSPF